MTVLSWIDVFTRQENRRIIIDSLRYCIKEKGLNVYAYCLMSNHLHMIVNSNEPYELKDTIRDFKKYTAKKNMEQIIKGNESRREWMMETFKKAAKKSKKYKNFKFWKSGNHALELYSEKFKWKKVNYIHHNPVKAGLVNKAEDWRYSSAENYAEEDDALLKEVVCLSPRLDG